MSVEQIKKAMLGKVADAPKTNEDETQKGVNNVHTTPEGRSPGTLDALWGDKPLEGRDGYPDVYGQAVKREAHDNRGALLERLFDAFKTTSPSEQKLMSEAFENADKGMPHSPILQHGKTGEKLAGSDVTLIDQVNRVIGHR